MQFQHKKIGFLGLLIGVSVLFLALWLLSVNEKTYARASKATPVETSEHPVAPDIRFLDENNHPVSLISFRGQVVLLSFWASWCGHCVRELSSLVALEKRLTSAGIPARVIFVNVDSNENDGRNLIKKKALPIAFFHDRSSASLYAFRSSFLPTTIIIDRDGRVVKVIYGEASWNTQSTVDMVHHVSAQSVKN